MKIEIAKEINSPKLFDELLMAGLIEPTQEDGTSPMQGNTLYLHENADTVAIQVVIDAHDPAPGIPSPTLESRIAGTEEAILFLMEVLG